MQSRILFLQKKLVAILIPTILALFRIEWVDDVKKSITAAGFDIMGNSAGAIEFVSQNHLTKSRRKVRLNPKVKLHNISTIESTDINDHKPKL